MKQGEVTVKVEEGPKTVTGLGADTDIICYGGRSSRPAGLFSLGLLDVHKTYACVVLHLREASGGLRSQPPRCHIFNSLNKLAYWKSRKDDGPKINYI